MDTNQGEADGRLRYYEEANASIEIKAWFAEHLRLVHRVAFHVKARCPSFVEVDDLIQAGFVGLLEARDSYNKNFGTQFSTYAMMKIKYSVYEYLRKSSGITRDISQNIKKINEVICLIEQKEERASSVNIATNLGVSLDKYYAMSQEIDCYEQIIVQKEAVVDDVPEVRDNNPMQHMLHAKRIESLRDQLKTLDKREQTVLALYYNQQMTLKEIGELLDLTEARVSQLHAASIRKLKNKLTFYEAELL